MSDRLKFRAWDKRNNKMITPNNGDFIGWHAMSNWRDCLDVMQWTGLTDSEGAEIYEGDIIDVSGYRSNHLVCRFPFLEVYEFCEGGYVVFVDGNIYENPELLEEINDPINASL